MINTVAVIGSGPDFQPITADVGYFANYSILRRECESAHNRFKRIFVAISEAALFPEIFLNNLSRVKEIVEQRERLLQVPFDGLKIFSSSGRRISEPEFYLPVVPDYVDIIEQQRALKKLASTSLPVWDWHLLERMLQLQPEVRGPLLGHFIKSMGRQLLGGSVSSRGYFRPSTGINTLLHALSVHGAETHYYVNGIQLTARSEHAIFESSNATHLPSIPSLPKHQLADRIIVRRLTSSKKYNIEFL